jgi:hypothetical protein
MTLTSLICLAFHSALPVEENVVDGAFDEDGFSIPSGSSHIQTPPTSLSLFSFTLLMLAVCKPLFRRSLRLSFTLLMFAIFLSTRLFYFYIPHSVYSRLQYIRTCKLFVPGSGRGGGGGGSGLMRLMRAGDKDRKRKRGYTKTLLTLLTSTALSQY